MTHISVFAQGIALASVPAMDSYKIIASFVWQGSSDLAASYPREFYALPLVVHAAARWYLQSRSFCMASPTIWNGLPSDLCLLSVSPTFEDCSFPQGLARELICVGV